jgi:hypothetical protein
VPCIRRRKRATLLVAHLQETLFHDFAQRTTILGGFDGSAGATRWLNEADRPFHWTRAEFRYSSSVSNAGFTQSRGGFKTCTYSAMTA